MPKPLLCLLIAAILAPAAAAAEAPWKGASWVWDSETDTSPSPRHLRRTFGVAGKPKSARAWVVADDRHACYVNGQKVGEKPSWNEAGKYDILPHLKKGKNVIAVEAVNDGGIGGTIAWVEVVGADGKATTFGTGKDWRITSLAPDEKWKTPDFDDAHWPAARVLGPAGMGPWNILGQPGGGAPLVDKYQPAEKEQQQFFVPEGYKIELVAAEPLLINPVSLALDETGRMFVGESHTYRYGPDGSPVKPYANPIVMLDPLPGGKGFRRVVVAEGFDDPCMGLLVKNGKLWATSNQYLYQFDLGHDGKATNKRLLLEDRNKAWNPFGFFMIEWGPDGLLYLSVGDHEIKIDGPTHKSFGARGRSGMVCRMKPDGSDIELLTQGFRVPYAFEFDPFGRLWLLSNGEGNPNRYAKVIPGVDYFCFTRDVDPDWLRGTPPLAPPVIERPRGAATALLHYYGAGFPKGMHGDQFLINWGPHGFGKVNHTIDRYKPDGRGDVAGEPEQWLGCDDPHFRPTTVLHSPDGHLLIADWYGRDDESDVTGRIWKLSYTGADSAGAAYRELLERARVADPDLFALGSPSHLDRENAAERLVARGNAAVGGLADVAAGTEPLSATGALWVLARVGTPEALAALARGADSADWRVRKLAVELGRRYAAPNVSDVAARLAEDKDPAVRVAAAVALGSPDRVRDGLRKALAAGAAADRHLRYEAASHLARVASPETFAALLRSDDEGTRTAGLIAADVALYEKLDTAPAALAAVTSALADPGKLDVPLLLDLAMTHRGGMPADARAKVVEPVQKLLARPGLEPQAVAKAVLLLRALSPGAPLGDAAKTALDSIAGGQVQLRTTEDKLSAFELLDLDPRPDFARRMIDGNVREGDDRLRAAANALALELAPKNPGIRETIWRHVADKNMDSRWKVELLATAVAAGDADVKDETWVALLSGADETLARDLVRVWRRFAGRESLKRALVAAAPALIAKNAGLAEELAYTFGVLGVPSADRAPLKLPAADVAGEAKLREDVLKRPAAHNAVALGARVFARAGCAQCHSAGLDTRLGPPLAGIGATQTREYLLESIFEPSKVIKTGFETEVMLAGGKTYSGLVREDGDHLRVITATGEDRVPLSKVTKRRVQKLSIMPEDLERAMSPGELADLLAYLQSLKAAPAAK